MNDVENDDGTSTLVSPILATLVLAVGNKDLMTIAERLQELPDWEPESARLIREFVVKCESWKGNPMTKPLSDDASRLYLMVRGTRVASDLAEQLGSAEAVLEWALKVQEEYHWR